METVWKIINATEPNPELLVLPPKDEITEVISLWLEAVKLMKKMAKVNAVFILQK